MYNHQYIIQYINHHNPVIMSKKKLILIILHCARQTQYWRHINQNIFTSLKYLYLTVLVDMRE